MCITIRYTVMLFTDTENFNEADIIRYTELVSHKHKTFLTHVPLYRFSVQQSLNLPLCLRTDWINLSTKHKYEYDIHHHHNIGDEAVFQTNLIITDVKIEQFIKQMLNQFKLTNIDSNSTCVYINNVNSKIKFRLRTEHFNATVVKYNISDNYPKKEIINSSDLNKSLICNKDIRFIIKPVVWTQTVVKSQKMYGYRLHVMMMEIRYPDQEIEDLTTEVNKDVNSNEVIDEDISIFV